MSDFEDYESYIAVSIADMDIYLYLKSYGKVFPRPEWLYVSWKEMDAYFWT